MDERERLLERYDEAYFSLLMHDLAERNGEALLEKDRQLSSDDTYALPKSTERRCLRHIGRVSARRRRGTVLRRSGLVLVRAAVSLLIAAVLFGAAFAAFPALREHTLDLLLTVNDKVAQWRFVDDGPDDIYSSARNVDPATPPSVMIQWLPDGYISIGTEYGLGFSRYRYENAEESIIEVSVYTGYTALNTDTQDADFKAPLEVQGHTGWLVEKQGCLELTWADEEYGIFVDVFMSNTDRDALMQIAENIFFS